MPWKEPGKGGQGSLEAGRSAARNWTRCSRTCRPRFARFSVVAAAVRQQKSGSSGSGGILPLLLVLLVFWAAWDSVHIVDEAERGVVLRFGKYTRELPPGINLTLPRPFETVEKVNISTVRTVEDRGKMLTEDENLVDFAYQVQYRVNDPKAFLFEVREPEMTLRPGRRERAARVGGYQPAGQHPRGHHARGGAF